MMGGELGLCILPGPDSGEKKKIENVFLLIITGSLNFLRKIFDLSSVSTIEEKNFWFILKHVITE